MPAIPPHHHRSTIDMTSLRPSSSGGCVPYAGSVADGFIGTTTKNASHLCPKPEWQRLRSAQEAAKGK
jgi:hypothetical protein